MAKSAVLIFPHQLFSDHPALNAVEKDSKSKKIDVFLCEDPLFFGDADYPAKFHKQKLVLHRASMQLYAADLEDNYNVTYLEYADLKDGKKYQEIAKQYDRWLISEVVDDILEKRLRSWTNKNDCQLVWQKTPQFVTSRQQLSDYHQEHSNQNTIQTDFYIWQRKRLDILINDKDKPTGGKWTYDTDNRKKLPKNHTVPQRNWPKFAKKEQAALDEAKKYVEKNFGDNPGSLETFRWPITHHQAEHQLSEFADRYLAHFGTYQDAFGTQDEMMYHSLLSSSLNNGLLTPEQVLTKTLEAYHKKSNDIPLNAIEGFVRQVIGWREYMRYQYYFYGSKQRTSNHFKHQRQLTKHWYQGTTKLRPVDDVIQKVLRTGYAHHIERLMVLGNAMGLCELQPQEVYRWFMEMFIDSYDWVMVPNVYAMSQYADGGDMVTKPYVSSANYILKMSNYSKNKSENWTEIWSGLYWYFIDTHKKEFKKNPRMSMMVNILNKMDDKTIKQHRKTARDYLDWLDAD